MMRLFHWAAAALLLLCGWLTGSAFQARTEQHILQLQRTVELLQRIRQEIAYRRLDLEQLQRCLVQEKLLESDAAQKLQEIPAPERFDDAERLCFEQCFAGLGQSEAAQECERLDYYSARFEAFLHQAQQKAASGQGLPCRLGLAAGAVAALILLSWQEDENLEIDLVFKIAAIGIIVAVLNQLLIRSGREDQAMMTTLAGLVVVLSILVKQISALFVTIKSLFAL